MVNNSKKAVKVYSTAKKIKRKDNFIINLNKSKNNYDTRTN